MSSSLPRRTHGQALAAIVPEDSQPSAVNLFGVPAGDVDTRPFRLARMQRVTLVDDRSPSGGDDAA